MFAAAGRGEIPIGKVKEWARASRGKKLPEHVKKSAFDAGLTVGIEKTAAKLKRVMRQKPLPVNREQDLASIPPGPEVEKMADDEHGGREPTTADKAKIQAYVRAHPGLKDSRFHDYAQGLGVKVPRAEETVYAQARALAGGRAEAKGAKKPSPRQMAMGQRVEAEHSRDPRVRREIAADHLAEIPDYYTRLRAMEAGAKTAMLARRKDL
jgi:hypothetical protein